MYFKTIFTINKTTLWVPLITLLLPVINFLSEPKKVLHNISKGQVGRVPNKHSTFFKSIFQCSSQSIYTHRQNTNFPTFEKNTITLYIDTMCFHICMTHLKITYFPQWIRHMQVFQYSNHFQLLVLYTFHNIQFLLSKKLPTYLESYNFKTNLTHALCNNTYYSKTQSNLQSIETC